MGSTRPGSCAGTFGILNDGFDPTRRTSIFAYGSSSDRVIVGDWDCDGVDTPGDRAGQLVVPERRLRSHRASHVLRVRQVDGSDRGRGLERRRLGSTPGVVRGNVWYLNHGLDSSAEQIFTFGVVDRPADRWRLGRRRRRRSSPGSVEQNFWFLNLRSNLRSPRSSSRTARATDRPVAGDWDGEILHKPLLGLLNRPLLRDVPISETT